MNGQRVMKLNLNTVKTEFLIIGTPHHLNRLDENPESTPYIIIVDGGEVKRTKCVTFLGMIVDDKLTWEQHIEYISSKITRIIIHQSLLYELLSNLIGSLLLYYDFILH